MSQEKWEIHGYLFVQRWITNPIVDRISHVGGTIVELKVNPANLSQRQQSARIDIFAVYY